MRKPILVCATTTVCAVIPAHVVTPRETTAPWASDTQLLALKWVTISFWLCRTAKLDLASRVYLNWTRSQSTTAPMSTTACRLVRGTSQKTGKKPPLRSSSGGTNLPKLQPVAVVDTNSGYLTPMTVDRSFGWLAHYLRALDPTFAYRRLQQLLQTLWREHEQRHSLASPSIRSQ